MNCTCILVKSELIAFIVSNERSLKYVMRSIKGKHQAKTTKYAKYVL